MAFPEKNIEKGFLKKVSRKKKRKRGKRGEKGGKRKGKLLSARGLYVIVMAFLQETT